MATKRSYGLLSDSKGVVIIRVYFLDPLGTLRTPWKPIRYKGDQLVRPCGVYRLQLLIWVPGCVR